MQKGTIICYHSSMDRSMKVFPMGIPLSARIALKNGLMDGTPRDRFSFPIRRTKVLPQYMKVGSNRLAQSARMPLRGTGGFHELSLGLSLSKPSGFPGTARHIVPEAKRSGRAGVAQRVLHPRLSSFSTFTVCLVPPTHARTGESNHLHRTAAPRRFVHAARHGVPH